MTASDFQRLTGLARGAGGLSRADMRAAMDLLLGDEIAEDDKAAFLIALKTRGETVDEIVAAAEAMRARVRGVLAPAGAIDTCGTGGDASNSFNISTAAALIVAGAGVAVAKHGNRAASSASGSSDVLTALGVNIHVEPATIEQCLNGANIGFMFAAYHHAAVASVAAVRRRLGVRTIFNLLGPLSNPAGARRQLLGVYDRSLIWTVAQTLGALGAERAWVVAGEDGMDELTTTGASHVCELADGRLREFIVTPEDAGLKLATARDLRGGDPQENAAALRRLLDGERGAYRDIAVLNAAAALIVAGRAATLGEGAAIASHSIDSGKAKGALARLVEISNEHDRSR